MIDFHAHIMPRVDHGCDSTAMAHRQLLHCKTVGVRAVVATPHFYPNRHRVEEFLSWRSGAAKVMCEKLPLGDLPLVYPAAEVLVCEGMQHMEGLSRLTVAGTNVILLEMPFARWSTTLFETVLAIREMGLCPVLAHIDRYPLQAVTELLREGIAAQLNAEAFAAFGGWRRYLPFVEDGSVVALGSDLHGAGAKDCRRFLAATEKLGTNAPEIFARTERLLTGAVPIASKENLKTSPV